MREINYIFYPRRIALIAVLTIALLLSITPRAAAERISRFLNIQTDQNRFETYAFPFAAGSDSVFCGDRQLEPGVEYDLNTITGRLTILKRPDCDSLRLTVWRVPGWLAEPYGNPLPRESQSLSLDIGTAAREQAGLAHPRRFSLTGNKSFSFAVGRSGEGRFSQGLNVDFDALLSANLTARGSISDRIGAAGGPISTGSTTLISELDKYFFEIVGTRVYARGGDINLAASSYLPAKRIKGIYGGYNDSVFSAASGIGRPAGRFVSQKITGLDDRQGPYQLNSDDGRPTAVVPGSEKVYLDGQALEAGSDLHYEIDYTAGRIVFSPRVLITSRSRIEIDFEAAESAYERVVMDASTDLSTRSRTLSFKVGLRRETDEKNRLRFGSYSLEELQILKNAGDNPELAQRDGALISDSGSYILTGDTLGNQFYEFVGQGNGQYQVSFSQVGENHGDYRYIGDGVYEYTGENQGDYAPVAFLPLPGRDDQFFSALQLIPFESSALELRYEGASNDKNLFSISDDADNYSGLATARLKYEVESVSSMTSVRFRQQNYQPLYRLNSPDFIRKWALPSESIEGSELLLESIDDIKFTGHRLKFRIGYLQYHHNLKSRLIDIETSLLQNQFVSPELIYRSGNSEKSGNNAGRGLYEKINPRIILKPIKPLRINIEYDRELTKNLYGALPDIERYDRYRATVLFRKTVISASRRIDYRSQLLGYRGPQQDKIELSSEENIGRIRLRLAGTWLDQKQLDSERAAVKQRLYQTALEYHPASGWINLISEYRQNRQSARTTGYRYLQVNQGEGEYRLEDGQYLPDPDGDYIRIREELGEENSVTVSEKSHNVTLYPGRLSVSQNLKDVLSQVSVRLRTNVVEDLAGRDRHRLDWLLPWSSRSGLNYLRRQRSEGYSLLLFPVLNFYILNFAYGNSLEEFQGGESLHRSRKKYLTEMKNQVSDIIRSLVSWEHQRDDDRGGGISTLNLIKNIYSAGLIVNRGNFQLTPKVTHVLFNDRHSGGRGNGFLLFFESVFRRRGRGEMRLNMELRSLNEEQVFVQPEYLVTDGLRFGKSAEFQININYDLGRSMRLTLTLRDNIYENRSAEFNGRGELVARF